MSDDAVSNAEVVEQITKVPSYTPKNGKDPKRVAAGKKLAESNKIMREEHARYKASEESRRAYEAQKVPDETTEERDSPLSDGFLSQLSLTIVISLVGIGLTVYTIFLKKSGDTNAKPPTGEKLVDWQEPVEITYERQEAKPQPKTKVDAMSKTKPRPKFGM